MGLPRTALADPLLFLCEVLSGIITTMKSDAKKVWVEISRSALVSNIKAVRSHVGKDVAVWAVVKSNAYGHGIVTFSKAADKAGVDGFCVDSVIEGKTLRREGIKKPILVLGPTLPNLFASAQKEHIAITVSQKESLMQLAKIAPAKRPQVHLKIDTGMYRQGFYVSQLPETVSLLKQKKIAVVGVYSHFADSAELENASFTEKQFELFQQTVTYLRESGYPNLVAHIANSAAALTHTAYQMSAVRAGNSLYGLYSSESYESRAFSRLKLKPVLTWRALISEIKKVPAGESIGYGRTKRVDTDTTIALIPIGFWHGVPWELSNKGEVLIAGRRAPIVGRVAMDMISVDVTGIKCRVGSVATLIGKDKFDELTARQVATVARTRPQEVVTRINPLIERMLVK